MTAVVKHFTVTGDGLEAMRQIADKRCQGNLSEAMRRAFALAYFVDSELTQGHKLIIQKTDGTLERVEFIYG